LVMPRAFADPAILDGTHLLSVRAPRDAPSGSMEGSFGDAMIPADRIEARLEAGISGHVAMRYGEVQRRGGWIWREVLRHRLLDNGTVLHNAWWDIEVGDSGRLTVAIPEGWELERATLDGQPCEADLSSGGAADFSLPPHRRCALRLSFIHRSEPLG